MGLTGIAAIPHVAEGLIVFQRGCVYTATGHGHCMALILV